VSCTIGPTTLGALVRERQGVDCPEFDGVLSPRRNAEQRITIAAALNLVYWV
jgi:hypothetical protein